MSECIIDVSDVNVGLLFGDFDANIKLIEKELGVSVSARGGSLKITGDDGTAALGQRVLISLAEAVKRGEMLNEQKIMYAITLAIEGEESKLTQVSADCVCATAKGKPIKSKTLGQKQYIEAMNQNTIVFGIGPAGTGKTYLAVAKAVAAFRKKEVSRIIITRPAVEAGEKLGFLPGDLQNKVDPYLRPLHDALYDMIGVDNSEEMLAEAMEKRVESGQDILYLLQDMQEFELYGTVRAVVSVCDSLNYITDRDELRHVFELVNNYLDPEGIFLFDMNTVHKYRDLLGDTTIAENRDEGSFIWDNSYDEEEGLNYYELAVFLPREDGLYEKSEEVHCQKAYPQEEIETLIKEAGMELLAVYDAYTLNPATEDSERLFFVAREKGKKKQ